MTIEIRAVYLDANDCGNPFNNTITWSTGTTLFSYLHYDVGYMWGISDPHHALTGSPLNYLAITGYTTITKTKKICPCERFKGGDRNVLVISTTLMKLRQVASLW